MDPPFKFLKFGFIAFEIGRFGYQFGFGSGDSSVWVFRFLGRYVQNLFGLFMNSGRVRIITNPVWVFSSVHETPDICKTLYFQKHLTT